MSTNETPSSLWKWSVVTMLLLATVLNYMDRQTFAQTSIRFLDELGLDKADYGKIERVFGFAFAFGGIFFGFVADRARIYIAYPIVLVIWSIMGFSAAYVVEIGAWLGAETLRDQAYLGFQICRAGLGFFEAGQVPFSLVATSRLLTRAERSLGNGLLQSGTAIGSILTPIVVQILVSSEPGTWRYPYMVVGVMGLAWLIPWFILMRPNDLTKPAAVTESAGTVVSSAAPTTLPPDVFWRRFLVCACMVVAINLPWHFFRVWLPQFLKDIHHYEFTTINIFTAGFYVAADIGCVGIGFLVRSLSNRGWDVHWSRTFLYAVCALIVALGGFAAVAPSGPILFTLLLLVGAASLGLFPNYYAFSQDLSGRHQGKITGTLGFTTWMVSGQMQGMVGSYIQRTGSFEMPMIVMSLAPLVALVVLLVVWKQWRPAVQ